MLRQLGLFFFISCLAWPAFAENDIRYYDVEIILFEHLDAKNRQSEDWNARRRLPESDQAELTHELGLPYVLEAESPYDKEAMFIVLPDEQKRLLEEAKKIDESKTRRVLSHIAWRQPGLPKEQAIWVQFKQMVNAESEDKTQTNKLVPIAEATGSIDFLTGDKKFNPYIEGKIKVMLARYLHVDTDILYFAEPTPQEELITEPGSPGENTNINDGENVQQAQSTEPQVFLLKQLRRRIRSTELHYLDHPVMSMILMITPYEKPEEPGQATNQPASYKTLQ